MAKCNQLCFEFPGFGRRKIEADFGGGNVSSDGGVLLLRQVDRWMGLSKGLAKALPDKRDPDRITHCLESLLQQRIYGLALGYEDLNDHDTVRSDLVWQAAAERAELLSGRGLIPFAGHSERRAPLVMGFRSFLGSCSNDVNWSRRDRLPKAVGSSRASCE